MQLLCYLTSLLFTKNSKNCEVLETEEPAVGCSIVPSSPVKMQGRCFHHSPILLVEMSCCAPYFVCTTLRVCAHLLWYMFCEAACSASQKAPGGGPSSINREGTYPFDFKCEKFTFWLRKIFADIAISKSLRSQVKLCLIFQAMKMFPSHQRNELENR